MRAGSHYSDFKPVERALLELEIVEALPSNYSARGGGATVLHLKSETFGENLKIHAGGDDKLRIQFAPPKANLSTLFNLRQSEF